MDRGRYSIIKRRIFPWMEAQAFYQTIAVT
jgi:hypothetical protein